MKKLKVEAITVTSMVSFHRFLKFQSPSLNCLLYPTWIIIVTCFSLTFLGLLQQNQLSLPSLLVLGSINAMIALLPMGKPLHNIGYIAIESALIFFGTILDHLLLLPMLYILVVLQSCFLFKSRGRWITAGLSFLLFLVHQIWDIHSISQTLEPYQQRFFWTHSIAETLMFGLGLFFTVTLVSKLLEQSQDKAQLAIAQQQLQHYALQVEALTAVKDYNRMAYLLYNALGHTLTAQNIQLQTAVKLWQHDPGRAKSFLEQAQQLAVEAMHEIRQSVRAFQSSV